MMGEQESVMAKEGKPATTPATTDTAAIPAIREIVPTPEAPRDVEADFAAAQGWTQIRYSVSKSLKWVFF